MDATVNDDDQIFTITTLHMFKKRHDPHSFTWMRAMPFSFRTTLSNM